MNTADANKVIDYLAEQVKEQAIQIAMLRANADALRQQVEVTQAQDHQSPSEGA